MESILPNRHEGMGESRKLNNELLYHLYASPGAIMVIKSRNIRWERHVTREVGMRSLQGGYGH